VVIIDHLLIRLNYWGARALLVFWDKIALNNPEYAPRGSYLRFTGNDEYNLKTAFIGDLNITLGRDSKW